MTATKARRPCKRCSRVTRRKSTNSRRQSRRKSWNTNTNSERGTRNAEREEQNETIAVSNELLGVLLFRSALRIPSSKLLHPNPPQPLPAVPPIPRHTPERND